MKKLKKDKTGRIKRVNRNEKTEKRYSLLVYYFRISY